MDDSRGIAASGRFLAVGTADVAEDGLVVALRGLARDPARVAALPSEAAVEVLGLLRVLEIAVLTRELRGSGTPRPEPVAAIADTWLTADEVALRLKRTRAWVYRQARRWPFARRLTRRTLLISERGLTAWMSRR